MRRLNADVEGIMYGMQTWNEWAKLLKIAEIREIRTRLPCNEGVAVV